MSAEPKPVRVSSLVDFPGMDNLFLPPDWPEFPVLPEPTFEHPLMQQIYDRANGRRRNRGRR